MADKVENGYDVTTIVNKLCSGEQPEGLILPPIAQRFSWANGKFGVSNTDDRSHIMLANLVISWSQHQPPGNLLLKFGRNWASRGTSYVWVRSPQDRPQDVIVTMADNTGSARQERLLMSIPLDVEHNNSEATVYVDDRDGSPKGPLCSWDQTTNALRILPSAASSAAAAATAVPPPGAAAPMIQRS